MVCFEHLYTHIFAAEKNSDDINLRRSQVRPTFINKKEFKEKKRNFFGATKKQFKNKTKLLIYF